MARTILLVDDEPEQAESLFHHLKQQGYAVRFAKGGTEALRQIAAQPPDLIVCDLEMLGIGGYQVLAAIASHPETRGIAFLLANDVWTLENWSKSAGGRTADCHIVKPYNLREAEAFVRRIFKSLDEDAYWSKLAQKGEASGYLTPEETQTYFASRTDEMANYRHSLEELLAGVTEQNRHPEINWGSPVGREVVSGD